MPIRMLRSELPKRMWGIAVERRKVDTFGAQSKPEAAVLNGELKIRETPEP